MPKFDWNQFPAEQRAQSNGPAKFDWNSYPSEGGQQEMGILETIDSYTGAPVRAAIGAVQDDKGFGGAVSAFTKQFGEDTSAAPTGSDIRKKAGIDIGDKPLIDKGGTLGRLTQFSPLGLLLQHASPNDVVDFGIEAAADVTNVIPVGAIAKKAVTTGAKGVSKAVQGAAKVSDAITGTAAKTFRRGVQGVFGVPEEAITHYLSRHPDLKDKVGAREMMEELAGRLDEGLKPHRARLEAAEQAVQNAKAKRSEDLSELMVKRQEAKDALKLAQEQALGEAASRVSSRVKQLDTSVKEGSSKAFNILDEEGVTVPVTSIKSRLTQGIKSLEVGAVTDEQQAVVDLLKRYRERLDKFKGELPGGEAKRLIQSLDREVRHIAPGEVGRMSKADQALSDIRRMIDAPLKKSGAYASQMGQVADDMKVLSQAQDLASESAAARALSAAARPTGKDKAEILRALGGKFGEDFLESVNRSNLPEAHKLRGILARYRAAKKGGNVRAAEQALESLKAELGGAKQLTEQGLAGISDRISSFVRASDPKAVQTESIMKAGELAGVNMADELADIKTIASFEKGYNRGSANTNFWGAVIGGLGGSVMGPGGLIGGVAAGGALGRIVIDNFGPRVARIILDQAPLLQKMAPSQWIRRLDVPNEVKARLAQDLLAYKAMTQGARGTAAASKVGGQELSKVASRDESDREPAQLKGPDKWARDGATKLGISGPEAEKLLNSKEGKRLLIEASDLKPGNPRLKRIKERLEGLAK